MIFVDSGILRKSLSNICSCRNPVQNCISVKELKQLFKLKVYIFRSFVAADVDFDGKVSVEEFDGMIEAAAALPRSEYRSP